MKNLWFVFAFFIFALVSCQNNTPSTVEEVAEVKAITYENKPFLVNGAIDGLKIGSALLKKRGKEGYDLIDSVALADGAFSLKGMVSIPEVYSVYLVDEKGEDKGRMNFFAQAGELMINANIDSLNKAAITGSDTELKYRAFLEKLDEWDDKIMPIYKEFKEASKAGKKEEAKQLEAKVDALYEDQQAFIKLHVKSHPEEPTTPYIIRRYLTSGADYTELATLVEGIALSEPESSYTTALKEHLAILKRVAIGQPSIDFTQNDAEGNPIALSSLKGQYVLVDFWASWCGPCREENPNVVEAHNKYKDKGFTVHGVSFDKDKEKWLKAVEKDKLNWSQVSDLKGWGNEAGKLYGVRGIPHSILLDKDGVIIAKDLRGEKLHEKLAELLDTKEES